MKSVYVLALGAAAMLASPAMAQGSAFSGAYLGVTGGFDSLRADMDGDSESESGVVYGAVAGYDYSLGRVVVGLEAEVAGSGIKFTNQDPLDPAVTASLKAGRDIYVGARVGTQLFSNALLYAKAGYTNAKLTLNYDDGVDVEVSRGKLDGFRLGTGVEYNFGRFGLRGEYRYSHYSKLKLDAVNTDTSFDRHQVVATLLAKF